MLIGCKALPYEDWKGVIDRAGHSAYQSRPWKAIPITHHLVPDGVSEVLRNNGIEIIEDVRPEGTGNAGPIGITKDVFT